MTTGNVVPTPNTPVMIPALSFPTPVEATDPGLQCGRVDFNDVHVAAPRHASDAILPFPTGCGEPATLAGQELLWAFLFFDRSNCVTAGRGPMPPPKP